MKKTGKRTGKILGLVVWGLLVSAQVVHGEEAKNLLTNPGFEEIKPFTVPEKWQGKIEATEMPKGWGINFGFPGKLTVIYDAIASHGGSKYIRLSREEKGKSIAFTEAGRWGAAARKANPGEKYSVSIWAKGKGTMAILAYMYTPHRAFKFSRASKRMEVSSEKWKEYKFEFTVPEGMGYFTPAFHINGTVDLDDASLFLLKDEPN